MYGHVIFPPSAFVYSEIFQHPEHALGLFLLPKQRKSCNVTTQANLQQEINNVNSDLKPLGFYPIISQGFSVRF